MSATASRSDDLAATPAPARQRAEGRIGLRVEQLGGRSRATRIAESGASRLRLPKTTQGLDAVMLNVAGGIACGDRMSVEIEVGRGAEVALATPGAERIYRSDGPVAAIDNRLTVEPGGRLSWLPQETILFDRARLERRLEADVAEDGRLTVCEALIFGRAARGETVQEGHLRDRWRVRRGGRLVFAENLAVSGPIHDLLGAKTVAAGATSLATLLHVAPDAEALLEPVREALGQHAVEAGASAWNGLLVVRMLSPTAERLRDAARAVLPVLTGRPLPRVWTC